MSTQHTAAAPSGQGGKKRRIAVNPPVFYTSAVLIVAFALLGSVFPARTARLFAAVQAFIVADFGWFYIAAVAGFLAFAIFMMFSRHGDVRLGPDGSEPEYSYTSWFAMLFSAGMGIGLLFFGVAEPVQHYAAPPVGPGRNIDAAREAMVLTFFHWGLHAWAIYAVVGLALAYFAFRRGLPLTIRAALYPLIGERIHGVAGHVVDIFAVLGTVFGVATSLGFGVLQINAGATYLFGWPANSVVQVSLIAGITAMATLSAGLGLDRGIKRLSELNIALATVLMVFVLVAGSTIFLLQAFVQNVGAYLGAVVSRTFRMYAYEPNPWLADWTLFYWAWWIAWSPFVGMFIARISRGRTIREFIGGVLLVPVLFTFLWMTVFGNTAIQMDLDGVAAIADTVANNLPVALFETLRQLPWSAISAGLATLLVMTFFVTSADSGALVIDLITSGGASDAPAWQRVFWAVCCGTVAAVLLLAGGLEALQTAAIASALPFAVVLILVCYGLLRALQREGAQSGDRLSLAALAPPASPAMSWQQRLTTITRQYRQDEIETFLEQVAGPALQAVATQMRSEGLEPQLLRSPGSIELLLPQPAGAFSYRIRNRSLRAASFTWAEAPRMRDEVDRHFRAMAQASGGPHRDVTGFSAEQLIQDLLTRLARFRDAGPRLPA